MTLDACPHCRAPLEIQPSLAGPTARCPNRCDVPRDDGLVEVRRAVVTSPQPHSLPVTVAQHEFYLDPVAIARITARTREVADILSAAMSAATGEVIRRDLSGKDD